MKKKMRSLLGGIVLISMLGSAINVTALAEQTTDIVNTDSNIVNHSKKATSTGTTPTEGSGTEDDTIISDDVETELEDNLVNDANEAKGRSANVASSSNAYIPTQNPVWQVGEGSLDGKDYPGWGRWDKSALSKEEQENVRYTISQVKKDGEFLGRWNMGMCRGEMDYRYYFTEAGDYQFRTSFQMTSWGGKMSEDDWGEYSPVYSYEPPAEKVPTPTGVKWRSDGSLQWDHTPGEESYIRQKSYVVEIYRKDIQTGEFERIDAYSERNNVLESFRRKMEKGAIYKARVISLGDLIQYANSDPSEFSKEFVMESNSNQGNSIIDGILQGEVKDNVEHANLSEDDKGSLKLAVQADSGVADNYEKLEEAYKTSAGAANLAIGTGESFVDANKVKIIGGVLNGATGIKFEKPSQEDLDSAGVTNYRKYSAVNITLEGTEGGSLKFPVLITMPVPEGIHPDDLTIVHIKKNGEKEIIRPRKNADKTVSFAVTEFSSFLFVEEKTTGGDGGGSSSGGGSTTKSASLETPGTWIMDANGWWFKKLNGSYPTSEWVMNGGNWFRFDEKGYMISGWFTDADGKKFYLNSVSDGTKGAMKTGWQLIENKWYYFNQISDGTRGALLTNTTTPDGYTVNAEGIWVQ